MLGGCCKHIWKLQLLLLVTFSARLSRMYHKIKWICRLWFEMCNKMSALVREMIWLYTVSSSTQTPETVNTVHKYSGHYFFLIIDHSHHCVVFFYNKTRTPKLILSWILIFGIQIYFKISFPVLGDTSIFNFGIIFKWNLTETVFL